MASCVGGGQQWVRVEEAERSDAVPMALQLLLWRGHVALIELPQLERAIIATRRHEAVRDREGADGYIARMARVERAEQQPLLRGRLIVQLELPIPARREDVTVGRDVREPRDLVAVSRHRLHDCTVGVVEHVDVARVISDHELALSVVEAHGGDRRGHHVDVGAKQMARAPVPDHDRPARGGAERHRVPVVQSASEWELSRELLVKVPRTFEAREPARGGVNLAVQGHPAHGRERDLLVVRRRNEPLRAHVRAAVPHDHDARQVGRHELWRRFERHEIDERRGMHAQLADDLLVERVPHEKLVVEAPREQVLVLRRERKARDASLMQHGRCGIVH